MNGLLLTAIVVTLTLQNVFKKAYTIKKKDVFGYNAAFGVAGAIVFLIYSKGKFNFCPEVLPYIIGFSVCFIICVFCSLMAVKTGSLALSSLIISYSLIIPTVYGLIRNPYVPDVLFYIGVVLLIVSLFLVNYKKGKVVITKRWLIYVVLAFLCNGLCSTIQNTQMTVFKGVNGGYKAELMLTVYVSIAVIMFIMSFIKEKQSCKERFNKYIILALACGVVNAVNNLLVMVASGKIHASIMFPIISGGSILATAALAYFYYKEKLSKQQLIGILLGTASVVCLSI